MSMSCCSLILIWQHRSDHDDMLTGSWSRDDWSAVSVSVRLLLWIAQEHSLKCYLDDHLLMFCIEAPEPSEKSQFLAPIGTISKYQSPLTSEFQGGVIPGEWKSLSWDYPYETAKSQHMVLRFRLSFYQQGIGHIPLESLCMFALVDYISLNIPLGDADGVRLVCP